MKTSVNALASHVTYLIEVFYENTKDPDCPTLEVVKSGRRMMEFLEVFYSESKKEQAPKKNKKRRTAPAQVGRKSLKNKR